MKHTYFKISTVFGNEPVRRMYFGSFNCPLVDYDGMGQAHRFLRILIDFNIQHKWNIADNIREIL